MQTRYLKTLVAAVEAGSFSRAAEALNITQSAVSQRMKYLEEFYGHQILDRSGPVLVPTEAGKLVLEKAHAILDIERGLAEDLKRFGEKKRLSLCCTPTFGMAYLPEVLNEFIRQNADVADLKFIFNQPEQAVRGLQENDYDLAVIEHCEGFPLDPFEVFELSKDELVFISAPSLEIDASLVGIESLLKYRLFARRDGCSSKSLLRANLAAVGKEIEDFKSVVISDDLRLTIERVLAGGGISFVSSSLVKSHLATGTLRAHHVEEFNHFRCRSIVLNRGRAGEPLVKNFCDCVFSAFPGEAPGLAVLAGG